MLGGRVAIRHESIDLPELQGAMERAHSLIHLCLLHASASTLHSCSVCLSCAGTPESITTEKAKLAAQRLGGAALVEVRLIWCGEFILEQLHVDAALVVVFLLPAHCKPE